MVYSVIIAPTNMYGFDDQLRNYICKSEEIVIKTILKHIRKFHCFQPCEANMPKTIDDAKELFYEATEDSKCEWFIQILRKDTNGYDEEDDKSE